MQAAAPAGDIEKHGSKAVWHPTEFAATAVPRSMHAGQSLDPRSDPDPIQEVVDQRR